MTESSFGDGVYEAGSDPDDDQTYSTEADDTLSGQAPDEDAETDYSPPDFEPKSTRYGTTELEQLEGESLDQKLAEEEPDVGTTELGSDELSEDSEDDAEDPRAGRLVAPDEGAHGDAESDEVAEDVGPAGYASSAEEAAVHVIDEEDQLT
ncbi:MAG: DUF5709 domain-containing protein [Jatrophihabitans sp.]